MAAGLSALLRWVLTPLAVTTNRTMLLILPRSWDGRWGEPAVSIIGDGRYAVATAQRGKADGAALLSNRAADLTPADVRCVWRAFRAGPPAFLKSRGAMLVVDASPPFLGSSRAAA